MSDQHRCGLPVVGAMRPADVEQSVPVRLRAIARAHRDCLAVQDDRHRMSYGELEALANGIARAIVARGDGVREPVVLLLRQGVPSVAATLGTLAAGRPFAPLDPTDPPGRLTEIADHLGAGLVLTDAESRPLAEALRRPGRDILVVGATTPGSPDPPEPGVGPDALASIYFTSGSTGSPKGVLDTHRNVLHNVMRYTRALAIEPSDRLSLLQSPSFSGAASSMFGALVNGAALFPMRAGEERPDALATAIRARRITIYHSVPSILRTLVAVDGGTFPDVRVVRLEGDRAASGDVALHRRYFAPRSILANGLGTTETGLCRQLRVATTDPAPEGILPVGYPVTDVAVDVVDATGRPVPRGEVGEIAVRSRYLAVGYWRRPDLTEAAFAVDEADLRRRVYRTGDLGRMRPDGCLEFLGRRDGHLKVLGRRIEPAEVEGHLLALAGVVEAAVTTQPGRRGEGRLVAHVVVGAAGPEPAAIRYALRGRLPASMVPATIEVVEALPLTGSGKVDRGALAPTPRPSRGRDETQLLALWERVLERRGIGVDDDFFALGGDSLAAAELLAALEAREGRELSESLLVRAPTAARLAAELSGGGGGDRRAGLVTLQPLGTGAPLVVVHGLHFGVDAYAHLVTHLGPARTVWGLEAPRGARASIPDLAESHARALRAERPDGPHVIAGFCSAAAVALEVARLLRAEASEVALVALIGIDAADFPALVSPAAAARHRAAHRLVPRARRYHARSSGRDLRHRAAHLADGALALAREAKVATGPRLRASGAVRRSAAMGRRARGRLPGDAILYLATEATARYTDDPAADWAGLAERLTIEELPGANDDLLRPPLVADLAARIDAAIIASGA